jgi:sucrose-6F-phosphate phosphohydrolase
MKQLLASDLDGTLIPLEKNSKLIGAIQDLSDRLLLNASVSLAYVTGRHFELAIQGISEYRLPEPDFIICDVGTSLYLKNSDDVWIPDISYYEHLDSRWSIRHASELLDILSDEKRITLQEECRQTPLKLSYYASIESENILSCLTDLLQKSGIHAKLIFSIDEVNKQGLIDILPPNTAKHSALDYLCKKENLEKSDVVYAGDSGNDLSVVYAGYKSILVGNTQETVIEKAKEFAKHYSGNLYTSKEHSASGVIEGCLHFGIL